MTIKKYSRENLDLVNTIFLGLSPLVALGGVMFWLAQDGFSWGIIALATFFYFLTGFGITIGYHRLFSHRAFKANRTVKITTLIFGGCALQNSALKWCNDHRIHHSKVDTSTDPYNINEGFFYAHMGWILLKENADNFKHSRDLLSDPLVMLQHKYYLPMVVIFGFILPGILGHLLYDSFLGGFFVAGFLRMVIVHHATFLINSLCHIFGKRPYDKGQTARDSWLMALFTFGEGYHNYHHAFQTDYRNGIRWYHYDPSKWIISILYQFGFTWDLKVARKSDIVAKKIQANLSEIKDSKLSELAENISGKTKQILTQIRDKSEKEQQEFMAQLDSLLIQSKLLLSTV